MSIHCFSIRATQPEPSQAELNQFLRSQRVVSVQRHFVADGADSYWAFCVEVAEGQAPLPAALRAQGDGGRRAGGDGTAPDYKQILNEADFARFVGLREPRKQLAQREGVPVYAVFTNEQLAALAVAQPASLSEVAQVEGVGEARVRKYGADVLARLGGATSSEAP